MDYSYLPNLESSKINTAIKLQFSSYTPVLVGISTEWDNSAYYGTSENNAILRDTFVLSLKEGATYDIFSRSYFDPFILTLHDSTGKVVAIDGGSGSYGSDIIYNYKALYSGEYYINASWDQGYASSHKYVSISIYEDVDTISYATPSGEVPKSS